jgi:hypothetical protein
MHARDENHRDTLSRRDPMLARSAMVAAAAMGSTAAHAQRAVPSISERKAAAIGVDAYLYFHRPADNCSTEKIRFERGKSFDPAKAELAVRKVLEGAPAAAQQLMESTIPTIARVVSGWPMNTNTMGVYGDWSVKRAIVAHVGLGANLPKDAVYPLNLADDTGKPLDGANRYTLHFDRGATAPEYLLVDHVVRL